MPCEDYLTGAHSHNVPQITIDNEIQLILNKITSNPKFNPNQLFEPEKHLAFKDEYFKTVKSFTLKELGINKTHVKPISSFGATYPFPLLTPEAIDIMKWEAFQADNVKKYGRLTNPDFSLGTNRHDFHIGGYVDKGKAPFTASVYAHPRIAEIFSKFIGVEVQTIYNYDTNHVNVTLADSSKPIDGPLELSKDTDEQINAQNRFEKSGSILGQHYDSTPIAAIVMWECPKNRGGETIIIKGDESALVIPDTSEAGYCTLLQGRVIRHIASKPSSNSNRIATVCGYMPASPDLDSSVLTSVRPSILPRSLHDQFYSEWFEFRFKQLQIHLEMRRVQIMKDFDDGVEFDQLNLIEFCKDSESYLHESWKEMESAGNDPFPPPLFSTPYSALP